MTNVRSSPLRLPEEKQCLISLNGYILAYEFIAGGVAEFAVLSAASWARVFSRYRNNFCRQCASKHCVEQNIRLGLLGLKSPGTKIVEHFP
jgi:hypothetical protein